MPGTVIVAETDLAAFAADVAVKVTMRSLVGAAGGAV
jgi:hypothetical protein